MECQTISAKLFIIANPPTKKPQHVNVCLSRSGVHTNLHKTILTSFAAKFVNVDKLEANIRSTRSAVDL